ncbi:MAG: response regulator transcription factor [Armatimonadota bacterium]|nr:response regulator transcription factor [Armatimonadota bacterium]
MATILVIDDEETVLAACQRRLRDDGHEVLTARNGLDGIGMARRHSPDLVVLDIKMPGVNGLEVCRRLRQDENLGSVPVLFLTGFSTVEQRVEGLDAGGDDYLPKPFSTDELAARVRAILRRAGGRPEPTGDPSRIEVGALALERNTRRAVVDDRAVSLTPVEFDLLDHLMSHAGEVFSAEQLLQQVWGYSPGTGDGGLVRWHVKNLREKIEDDPSDPQYIKTVFRHGYTIPPEQ